MIIDKTLCDHKNFDKVINILINQCILVAKDNRYRLCELEVYYKNKDHPDDYVHCDDDQLDFEGFYFHKYKNGSYKAGTYKGMDITFGDRTNNTYYGILVRSIMNIQTNEFIEGPCKCVNEIIGQFGVETVKDFMLNKPKKLSISDKENELYIEKVNDLKKEDIYAGPRVGLSNKYPDYLSKNYRYAVFIKKIKKQKKFTRIEANDL